MIPIEPVQLAGARAGNTWRGAGADFSDPYSGFSVCHYVGDSPAHVAECRRELAAFLGVRPEALIVPRQTHGCRIAVVDRVPFPPEELESTDAVITSLPGVAVGVNTADCVPVLLSAPGAGIVAAVHAGWRGAVAGIVGRTVAKMAQLGAEPSDIRAAIRPCICVECFEVGEEVAVRFPEEFVVRRESVRPHVDLPSYVASQLAEAGIKPGNISMPQGCTRCNPRRYFSARAIGSASGRIFSFVMRK